MVSFVEVLTVLALIAVGAAFVVKGMDKKMKKKVVIGGLVVAFLGSAAGGLAFAGVPAYLTLGPSTGIEPKAGALWIVTFNSGSDTDRTETETISADGHTIDYYLADAQMDGLGDVDLEADVANNNQGLNTENWGPLEVSIASVGTVLVSAIPTPVANYTADRTRFNVAYSLTTAGAPTLVQVFDYAYSTDWVSGATDEVNMDMPIDPTVADDLPAGGSFSLAYSVGGILLTANLREP